MRRGAFGSLYVPILAGGVGGKAGNDRSEPDSYHRLLPHRWCNPLPFHFRRTVYYRM